jgi:hypothetical protein
MGQRQADYLTVPHCQLGVISVLVQYLRGIGAHYLTVALSQLGVTSILV